MNPLIVTLLWKFLVPVALEVLKKTGIVDAVSAGLLKLGTHTLVAVENAKIDPSYPTPPASTSVGPDNGNYNKK